MKNTLALLSTSLLLITAYGQDKEMTPKDTEVWEPIPEVVVPGESNAPPSDAIVLFREEADFQKNWIVPEVSNWVAKDNMIVIEPGDNRHENIKMLYTKESFGDVQLHIEWKTPTEITGDGQRRGNSGIFLQKRYEIQVLDSYDNRTYSNGQAASIYKQHIPLVNACKSPGEWQTYDIIFQAPRFNEAGELLNPAYVTVIHNGVVVQNHVEIKGSIRFVGYPEYEAHPVKQQLALQDHGDNVSFRNIWLRQLD